MRNVFLHRTAKSSVLLLQILKVCSVVHNHPLKPAISALNAPEKKLKHNFMTARHINHVAQTLACWNVGKMLNVEKC